jgi:hypothetical protein
VAPAAPISLSYSHTPVNNTWQRVWFGNQSSLKYKTEKSLIPYRYSTIFKGVPIGTGNLPRYLWGLCTKWSYLHKFLHQQISPDPLVPQSVVLVEEKKLPTLLSTKSYLRPLFSYFLPNFVILRSPIFFVGNGQFFGACFKLLGRKVGYLTTVVIKYR